MPTLVAIAFLIFLWVVFTVFLLATGRLRGDWRTLLGISQLSRMPGSERFTAIISLVATVFACVLVFSPAMDWPYRLGGIGLLFLAISAGLILKRRRNQRGEP
jgi:ABC-type sulfate transport system permease component